MAHVVKIIGLATGGGTPFDGQYLVDYDPDQPGYAPNGEVMLVHLATSPDITKAKRFETLRDIQAERGRFPKDEPLRPDGRPNRPLTAFTISIENAPPER
jgi:hypothetical protein